MPASPATIPRRRQRIRTSCDSAAGVDAARLRGRFTGCAPIYENAPPTGEPPRLTVRRQLGKRTPQGRAQGISRQAANAAYERGT